MISGGARRDGRRLAQRRYRQRQQDGVWLVPVPVDITILDFLINTNWTNDGVGKAEVGLAWRPRGTPALGEVWYGPMFGDANIVMNRIRELHEDVGREIAAGLARMFNDYCRRHGIERERDDTVYPLKFLALAMRNNG
jgi:hypothetical protein